MFTLTINIHQNDFSQLVKSFLNWSGLNLSQTTDALGLYLPSNSSNRQHLLGIESAVAVFTALRLIRTMAIFK